MIRRQRNYFALGGRRAHRRAGIVRSEELENAIKIGKRVFGIDYLRQGLGRAALGS